MSDINFCNTKEQLNHLGEVVTGKVNGSPTGADIGTSTLPYTGQVRKTIPALEGEYEQSITNKEIEADAAIDSYRLLNKGPYASGITLESEFEFITYNGESYFATNPPYTTTATAPDADANLFLGGYTTFENVANKIGNKNELSNSNFLTPSPDAITHPNATPESYVAGTQIFSGVYAGDSGCTVTFIDGRVNCTAGDYQFKLPNTSGLERIPAFTSSVSDYDGIPKTTGISHALVGDEYVVTVTPAAGGVFSVKLEQGSVATRHEAFISRKIKTFSSIFVDSTYTDVLVSGVTVGDTVVCEDYAPGNDAGILFFKVVPGGTGVNDGGKYIDISSGNLQLEQNLVRPYSVKAWGAIGDQSSDDTLRIQNAINYAEGRSSVYVPKGTYMISISDGVTCIQMRDGVTIFGDGFDSVVQMTTNDSDSYFMFNVGNTSNVTIENLNIIGDLDTHTGGPTQFCHCICSTQLPVNNLTIKNNYLSKPVGDGVYIGNTVVGDVYNIDIDANVVDQCFRQGISVTSGQDIRISNNRISNISGIAPEAGIDIEPNNIANHIVRDVIVDNNFITSCTGDAVHIYGPNTAQDSDPNWRTTTSCHNITINNNILSYSLNGIGCAGVVNMNASDNIIHDCTEGGINDLFQTRNPVISNNTIKDCPIAIQNNSEQDTGNFFSTNWAITGNKILRCQTGMSMKSTGHTIDGNNISISSIGITFDAVAQAGITDNVIKDIDNIGIVGTDSSQIIVQGNTFVNVSTAGVQCQGTSNRWMCRDNTWQGTAFPSVSLYRINGASVNNVYSVYDLCSQSGIVAPRITYGSGATDTTNKYLEHGDDLTPIKSWRP